MQVRSGRQHGQNWLGLTLLTLSVCVALGTFGGAYLSHWQQRGETRAAINRAAPFDSPVAARATLTARGFVHDAPVHSPTPPGDTESAASVAGDGSSPVRVAPPTTNLAPPPLAPAQPPREIAPQTGASPPATQATPLHVTIPAIGVDATVVEVGLSPTIVDGQDVSVWDVAAYAVGHHASSANPGEGENVVLSGHDDWQGEVFRDLYKLKKGDKIAVQAGGKTWNYHVETRFALQEIGAPLDQRLDNAVYIGPTGDERLTLITCWPYGVDDHRLIVIAKPD